jgi:hypothetical protein
VARAAADDCRTARLGNRGACSGLAQALATECQGRSRLDGTSASGALGGIVRATLRLVARRPWARGPPRRAAPAPAWQAALAQDGSPPLPGSHLSGVPCPLLRADGSGVLIVGCFPAPRGLPRNSGGSASATSRHRHAVAMISSLRVGVAGPATRDGSLHDEQLQPAHGLQDLRTFHHRPPEAVASGAVGRPRVLQPQAYSYCVESGPAIRQYWEIRGDVVMPASPGMGALVASNRLRRRQRLQPVEAEAFQDPADGAGETAVSWAICRPVQRCRRSVLICSTTASGVGARRRCGREDRSRKPQTPAASKRRTHLVTVVTATRMPSPPVVGGWRCPSIAASLGHGAPECLPASLPARRGGRGGTRRRRRLRRP